ncbi:MAG: hypothetical protein EHM20_10145 [Alphaproteobacteria bacterium]|nr:MAG: hypothetical protein EHM20_10145 [Alphaproteobacteria bacterium]
MNKYWIKFNGQSMSPLLRDNDEILIEPVGDEALKIGDVILFLDQSSKELTLHRLMALPLTTKGDFSLSSEVNPLNSHLGKALGFKRQGIYRALPGAESLFGKLFLYFSKQRAKGFFKRKMALVALVILTKTFEVCSEKTNSNHNEVPHLNDPSSRV